jgi:Domain of unknown function (DUF5666)
MVLKHITAGVAMAAAIIVAACGGGGGGIGGTGSPVATSYGGVTAIGSVWVNGVEFNTRSATIRDRSGATVVPKAGMVVQVDGSIADQRADTVTVEGSLQGLVESVTDANHIVVMGQTVRIDDSTCGDGVATNPQRPGCGALVAPTQGQRVEVHGLVVADGLIAGGYVSIKALAPAPSPAFGVKGFIRNVNVGATTFTIGTLTVNYGSATLSDLGAAPVAGQFIEVKGDTCSPGLACDTLTATSVRASGLRVSESAQAEVEGFVAPGSVVVGGFTVGTQAVTATGSTVFVGGTAADVLAGSKLEVEGAIRGGVLNATKVRFLDSIRIEASVDTVVNGTVIFNGLGGVSVTANALTELSGFASVGALTRGDFVRLRGRPAAGHAVVATRIELRNGGNNRTILQATVDAVTAPHLTLLGVDVDTTSVPDASFQGINETPSSRAAFFAAVKTGSLVKARGTPSGNTLVADEVEFED